ncbi:MAG: tetratricopeptide repeat protein [Cyanobacteria bacterium]|nr:tetratricopeptide repeat protein [Cyanobacteriota bacterium]
MKQLWIGGLVLLLGGATGCDLPAITAITAQVGTTQQLFERGNRAQERGDYAEAEQIFREILRRTPNDAIVHYNLGNALRQQGNLEGAIASHREALRLNPNLAETHNNLGNALSIQGNLEEAIASYRTALALLDDPATTPNPAHAAAYLGLGYALFLRDEPGDLEAAIESYDRAIAILPDFPQAQHVRTLAQERLDAR